MDKGQGTKNKKWRILVHGPWSMVLGLFLIGCAADWDPVYFPNATSSEAKEPARGSQSDIPDSARCNLQLTAKLCVKIKGEKLEAGLKPEDPLCADTPPIPMEIEGEKIIIKGSEFPNVQVEIDIKGVKTPLTINGKGTGDGSKNLGLGTWNPEGDITIKNFSFFVSVLGVSGEITGLNLTTDEAKEVDNLPSIKGSPSGSDGSTTLVTATKLGHLFEAADKYLLGASLQAVFEGKIDPPLSDCAATDGGKKQIRIVKTRLDPTGIITEEPLPEGNILEISKGTYIAQSPQDVGPSFEETQAFKASNTGSKAIDLNIPSHIGPFYLTVEGKSKRSLKAQQSVRFHVAFRPTLNETVKEATVRQKIRFGSDMFYLQGVALKAGSKPTLNRIDDKGETTAANVDSIILNTISAPAASVKDYFHCTKISCEGRNAVMACQKCMIPNIAGCQILPVNTFGAPLEEVDALCKAKSKENIPAIALEFSGNATSIIPSKQAVMIQNNGIADLVINNISIEEISGSKSKEQFKLFKDSILVGSSLENALPKPLPITLAPYQKGHQEELLYISVAYLPTDLLGSDGKQASPGQDVIDKAVLKITAENQTKTTQLLGRTRIQEIPELQVYFGTATGFKSKTANETFAMAEVTATTTDMATPVFLKLADAATNGLRITAINIAGKDAAFFEWLDTMQKVEERTPPSGSGKRCSIPIIDPATGRQVDENFDLSFTPIAAQGFDLKPGAHTLESMPLFGCINFHKEAGASIRQRLFKADLLVKALKLDAQGRLEHNADNTFKETDLIIHVVAVIDPIKGKMVLRITQTIAGILNPTSPNLSAMASADEVDLMFKEGRGASEEKMVMLGALILDPFDEENITDTRGRVVTTPRDGITAVFRELDTRPAATHYEDPLLLDFATLLHDSNSPSGAPNLFYDYDLPGYPLPNPLQVNGWRIFTGSLSYPGPLAPRAPIDRSECEVIDPCSPEGLSKFNESGVGIDDVGACAFFYVSAGRHSSPGFEPVINNKNVDLCATKDQPQDLEAMGKAYYSVDGSFTAEDIGLRFWGPTYIHNPTGPLGPIPPLDEVFHIAFTTEMLKPKTSPNEYEVLPEERLNTARLEHKINLSQKDLPNPPICFNNVHNRTYEGKKYSSWKYIGPLLYKDEAGEIPAGCKEADNDLTGGTAFLKGRRIDPATGIFSVVSVGKFSSKENLSLAFKNITIFIAMNGWVCNPQGDEKDFEGAKCFEADFNDRDANAQFSIIKGY